MDDLIPKLTAKSGRLLETVWWVDYPGTAAALRDRLQTILGNEDLLLVVDCKSRILERIPRHHPLIK